MNWTIVCGYLCEIPLRPIIKVNISLTIVGLIRRVRVRGLSHHKRLTVGTPLQLNLTGIGYIAFKDGLGCLTGRVEP